MSNNETLNLEVFDNPEFGQMRILREGEIPGAKIHAALDNHKSAVLRQGKD